MAQAFNLTAQLQLQAPGNADRVLNQIRRQLKPIGVQVKLQNTKNIAQANKDLRAFNKHAQSSSKSMSNLNRTLQESARRFSVITIATGSFLALANAFKNSVKQAVAFERELVKISQVTGKSVRQLESLSSEVTKLSTSLGTSSADLLNVARTLTQAGFAADKTKKALEVLAQTSLGATFDSIQDTTEGAIALLRQFGNEARSVGGDAAFLERSLSAISAVSKKFAVESGDLITAVRRTGGVFAAAGGSINELIALFTSVRATTRESAETIATGLRTIFTRIQRPETINQLQQFGIQLQDAQGNFVGAFEAFKRLSQGLKGLDARSSAFSQIVEDLGGFRQVGKVIPLIQQFTTAQQALTVAQGASGTVAKDAETAQQSLGVQIEKTRQQFDALIRKFVDSSAFRSLAQGGIELANAFIRIADSLEPLLPMLISLAGLKLGRSLAPALGSFVGIGARAGGRGPVTKFARGGVVPGSGNRDTVPAMLTPGEFVIKKSSVNKLGAGTLHAMNNNRYASGGAVELSRNSALVQDLIYRGKRNISKKGGVNFDTSKNMFTDNDKFTSSITKRKIRLQKKVVDRLSASRRSALLNSSNSVAQGNAFEDYLLATGRMTSPAGFGGNNPLDGKKGKELIEVKRTAVADSILLDKNLRHQLRTGNKLNRTKLTGGSDNIKLPPLTELELDKNSVSKILADSKKAKRNVKKKNAGGGISGSDTVPALLTPGEFVFNKSAAQSIGYGNLNRMNKHGVQGFANGGPVRGTIRTGGNTVPLGGGDPSAFLKLVGAANSASQSLSKIPPAAARLEQRLMKIQGIDRIAGTAQQFVFLGASLTALTSSFSSLDETTKKAVNRTSGELIALVGIAGTLTQIFTGLLTTSVQKRLADQADIEATLENVGATKLETQAKLTNSGVGPVGGGARGVFGNLGKGIKGLGAGLLTLAGGPVGAAILALTALVGVFLFAKNKVKAENEALAKAAKDLADKFRETGEGLDATRLAILQSLLGTNVGGAGNRTPGAAKKVMTPQQIAELEAKQRRAAFIRQNPDGDRASGPVTQTGVLKELSDAQEAELAQLQKDIDALTRGALDGFKNALNDSLTAFQQLKQTIKQSNDEFDRISNSVFDSATKFDKLSTNLEKAQQSVPASSFSISDFSIGEAAGSLQSTAQIQELLADPSKAADGMKDNFYLLQQQTNRLAEAQKFAAEQVEKAGRLFNQALGDIQSSADLGNIDDFVATSTDPRLSPSLAPIEKAATTDVARAFKNLSNAMRLEAKFRMVQLKIQAELLEEGSDAQREVNGLISEIQVSTNAAIEANRQYAEEVGQMRDIKNINNKIAEEVKTRDNVISSMERFIDSQDRLNDIIARSEGRDRSGFQEISSRNFAKNLENSVAIGFARANLQSGGVDGSLAGDLQGLLAARQSEVTRGKTLQDQEEINASKNKIAAIDREIKRMSEDERIQNNLQSVMENNLALIEKERAARQQMVKVLEEFVVGGRETRKALVESARGVQFAINTGTLQNQSEEQRRSTVGLLDKLSDVAITFDRNTGQALTGSDVKERLLFQDAIRLGLDPNIAAALATGTDIEKQLVDANKQLKMSIDMLNLTMGASVIAFGQIQQQNAAAGIPVQGNASGGMVQYRAGGGSIFKPRGTDTVPAMLTPGEFVIKRSAVNQVGLGALQAINNGGVAVGYQTGGRVVRGRAVRPPLDYGLEPFKPIPISGQGLTPVDADGNPMYGPFSSGYVKAPSSKLPDARDKEFAYREGGPLSVLPGATTTGQLEAQGIARQKEKDAARLGARKEAAGIARQKEKDAAGLAARKAAAAEREGIARQQEKDAARLGARKEAAGIARQQEKDAARLGARKEAAGIARQKEKDAARLAARKEAAARKKAESEAPAGAAEQKRYRRTGYSARMRERLTGRKTYTVPGARQLADGRTAAKTITTERTRDRAAFSASQRIRAFNAQKYGNRFRGGMSGYFGGGYGGGYGGGQGGQMNPLQMQQMMMMQMMQQMAVGFADGGIVDSLQFQDFRTDANPLKTPLSPLTPEEKLEINRKLLADLKAQRQKQINEGKKRYIEDLKYKLSSDYISKYVNPEDVQSHKNNLQTKLDIIQEYGGLTEQEDPELRAQKELGFSDLDFQTFVGSKKRAENDQAFVDAQVALKKSANPYETIKRFGGREQLEESQGALNPALTLNPDRNKRRTVDTPFGPEDVGLNPLFVKRDASTFKSQVEAEAQFDPFFRMEYREATSGQGGAFIETLGKVKSDSQIKREKEEADLNRRVALMIRNDSRIKKETTTRRRGFDQGKITETNYTFEGKPISYKNLKKKLENEIKQEEREALRNAQEYGAAAPPSQASVENAKRTAAAQRAKEERQKELDRLRGDTGITFGSQEAKDRYYALQDLSQKLRKGEITTAEYIAAKKELNKQPATASTAAAAAQAEQSEDFVGPTRPPVARGGPRARGRERLKKRREAAAAARAAQNQRPPRPPVGGGRPAGLPAGPAAGAGADMTNQMMQNMMMMQMMRMMGGGNRQQSTAFPTGYSSATANSRLGSSFLGSLAGGGRGRGGFRNNMVPFGYIPGSPYNSRLGGGIYNIPMIDKRLYFGNLAGYFSQGGGVDTVPAMLTPGEFVMSKGAVSKYGTGFMRSLNRGQVQGYNKGGLVQYRQEGGEVQGGGMVGFDGSQLESIFNNFVGNVTSAFDNITSSFTNITTNLQNVAQIFSQGFNMQHKVDVGGQINIAGINVEAIKDELSGFIGQYVADEVSKKMDEQNNKFNAG